MKTSLAVIVWVKKALWIQGIELKENAILKKKQNWSKLFTYLPWAILKGWGKNMIEKNNLLSFVSLQPKIMLNKFKILI